MRLFQWLCVLFVSATGLVINVHAKEEPPAFLRIGRGDIESVEWSPDGNFVFVSTVTGVWLYTADLQDLGHIPNAQLGALSPDGHTIAGTLDGQNIQLWDAKTLEPTLTVENYIGRLWSLEWSPNSQKVLATTGSVIDPIPVIFDFQATIYMGPSLTGISESFRFLMWNADSKSLVYYNPPTKQLHVGAQQFMLERDPDKLEWANSSYLLLSEYSEVGTTASLLEAHTGEMMGLCNSESFAFTATVNAYYMACHGVIRKLNAHLEAAGKFETGQDYIVPLSLNPDGTKIAVGAFTINDDSQSQILIMDTADGTILDKFHTAPENISLLKWHPDGNRLLSIGRNGKLTLFDMKAGRDIATQKSHTTSNGVMDWSDDSSLLGIADTLNNVNIWDAATGEYKTSLEDHQQPVTEIHWQPRGTLLATRTGNNYFPNNTEIRIWDVANTSDAVLSHIMEHPEYQAPVGMAWSPDGRQLLSVGQHSSFYIWSMNDLTKSREIPFAYQLTPVGASWSPDGNTIAAPIVGSGGGGGIVYYDLRADELSSENFRAIWTWSSTGQIISLTSQIGIPMVFADPEIHIVGQPQYDKSLSGLTEILGKKFLSPSGQYAIAGSGDILTDEQKKAL